MRVNEDATPFPPRFYDPDWSYDAQLLKVNEELREAEEAVAMYEAGHTPRLRERAGEEISDVIMAAANLAFMMGFDLWGIMEACEERNRERGRYDE